MTVLEVIQRSTDFLARKGVDAPRLQIELILAHVLKLPRLNLYLQFDRSLSESELDTVRKMVTRRGERIPLQHILGSTSFCGLEIVVSQDVLVPRPETEILAEIAWTFLNSLPQSGTETPSPPTALDFGTGSGCLAIAIAAHAPAAHVYGFERSERALAMAHENVRRHSLSARIDLRLGAGFNDLPEYECYDVIVSNPPYIPTAEIDSLPPEVRDHDPRSALDGGPDGLDFFRMFAAEAGPWLKSHGKLMLEFGDHQEQELERIFEAANWTIEAIEPDLTHRPRFFIAQPPRIREE